MPAFMRPTSETVSVEDDDEELDEEIEAQVNEWSSNSNECLTVRMTRDDGSVAASFHPEYTNAMFGQEEAIFGYQDLDITLSFRAHDLQPKLEIKYGKMFPAQGDVQPTDIAEALGEFLPSSTSEEHVDAKPSAFTPPGEKITTYRRNNKTYETWCASLADPAARKLLQNMQILVPMFIDGGSTLELEQDWTTQRWKIFLVYEVDHSASDKVSPYTLAGFATSYRIYTFPERQKAIQFADSESLEHFLPKPTAETNELSNSPSIPSPLGLPSRERLSQFLMLPPFHGAGHGQELYNTMYNFLSTPANIREFTIEDPNERFDDLRDLCDLLYLRKNHHDFASLRINPDIPPEKMKDDAVIPVDVIVPIGVRKQIMRETKIMPRQFDRLVEMHTLSFIPPANRSRSRLTKKEKSPNPSDRAFFFWRLYVKQRLYIFNKDQLAQVERVERVEKLEAALDSVLEAYSETIEKVQAREQAIADDDGADDVTRLVPASSSKRKRLLVTDDEEETEGDDRDRTHADPPSAKANGSRKKGRAG